MLPVYLFIFIFKFPVKNEWRNCLISTVEKPIMENQYGKIVWYLSCGLPFIVSGLNWFVNWNWFDYFICEYHIHFV